MRLILTFTLYSFLGRNLDTAIIGRSFVPRCTMLKVHGSEIPDAFVFRFYLFLPFICFVLFTYKLFVASHKGIPSPRRSRKASFD